MHLHPLPLPTPHTRRSWWWQYGRHLHQGHYSADLTYTKSTTRAPLTQRSLLYGPHLHQGHYIYSSDPLLQQGHPDTDPYFYHVGLNSTDLTYTKSLQYRPHKLHKGHNPTFTSIITVRRSSSAFYCDLFFNEIIRCFAKSFVHTFFPVRPLWNTQPHKKTKIEIRASKDQHKLICWMKNTIHVDLLSMHKHRVYTKYTQ